MPFLPSRLHSLAPVVLVVGAVHESRWPSVVVVDHLMLPSAKMAVQLISRAELLIARGAFVLDVSRPQFGFWSSSYESRIIGFIFCWPLSLPIATPHVDARLHSRCTGTCRSLRRCGWFWYWFSGPVLRMSLSLALSVSCHSPQPLLQCFHVASSSRRTWWGQCA